MTQETKKAIMRRKTFKKKIEKEEGMFSMDLPKGLSVILMIIITAQVFLSNIVGVKGAELVKLEEEKEILRHEKMVLESKLLEISSLSYIEGRCKEELSMKEAKDNLYYLSGLEMASL